MLNQVEFYRHPAVRERIAEYCGGSADNLETLSSEYLVGYGEALQWEGYPEAFLSFERSGFNTILEKGLDFFRSNWDKKSTIGVLDVEYFNMDYSGEVYLHQVNTFLKLEPMLESIKTVLDRFGLKYLTIMTGQGYHFSFRIPCNTDSDRLLENMGKVCESLKGKYSHPTGRRHRYVSIKHGQSFDGMGRVMNYLAHEILREYYGKNNECLPAVLTDLAVGNGSTGREAISIDLSMFADPIYMRDIRTPFSSHQKHKVQRHKVGETIASGIPVQIALPKNELSLEELIHLRRNFRLSAGYAESCSTIIPDTQETFPRLVEAYTNSRLHTFHQEFDSVEHDHWTRWGETYNLVNTDELPPCAAYALNNPNPHLLKPTNMQTLVRTLLSRGWHIKHIAGLVRSRFEQDYGWGDSFKKYDAGSRSNYYIRMFGGLIHDGLDKMVDHNCLSYQEKGYCLRPWCGFNLADFTP